MNRRAIVALGLGITLVAARLASGANTPGASLEAADPGSLGFDPARLGPPLDAAIERAIAEKKIPGAVAIVGRHGRIAYAAVKGARALVPAREEMTRDTLFDMASLTKPVATATSVLILIEEGKVRLDDPLARHLPEFDNHGKGAITIEQLLRHRSGLIADNPLADYHDGMDRAWERLANLEMTGRAGERFLYSDVNFEILGRLVEKVAGMPLDDFARSRIFEPIGMADTRFRRIGAVDPRLSDEMRRTAPTEPVVEGRPPEREMVHDPRSRLLGGVAGHAGLFSTADDLALFAQTLLNRGVAPNGRRVLSEDTVRQLFDPSDTPAGQQRGLGWDVATSFSSPRGKRFGSRGAGHTGFTGTSLWIDPPTDTFVILLTSRLHPDGKVSAPSALRSEVATLVAAAIAAAPFPPEEPGIDPVRGGIDVLAAKGFEPLKGKRVGLVTNHTGRTRDGKSTIDALFEAPDVKLVALFSPEHGIRGAVDTHVGDSKDEKTGLPIHSLYGATRKPKPESLADVDVLVYDIQDVGARFYTYISTLGLVIEAAKERGIPVVVLDRPNPIGGLAVAGPVRDDGFESFIAYDAIPVRHGLTVGELARLFNRRRGIGADLTVVPCEGWSRGDLYDRTGLLWVNPSPNMRSLTEALLYPGVGLLESTNLATGRGTDTPFERVGAPWIDPVPFADRLNMLGLAGVRFVPVRFSPSERQYKGEDCGGVYIQIINRERFEPLALALGMAVVLRDLYPQKWESKGFLNFLADRAAYQAFQDGKTPEEIAAVWQAELAEFRTLRDQYLIYRDE